MAQNLNQKEKIISELIKYLKEFGFKFYYFENRKQIQIKGNIRFMGLNGGSFLIRDKDKILKLDIWPKHAIISLGIKEYNVQIQIPKDIIIWYNYPYFNIHF